MAFLLLSLFLLVLCGWLVLRQSARLYSALVFTKPTCKQWASAIMGRLYVYLIAVALTGILVGIASSQVI